MASSSGGPGIPSSGSTSSSRRGLISCLHSQSCRVEGAPLLPDNDLPQAIYNLIVGFYEEAFNRLPCDAMPDIIRLLTTAGGGSSCLGLLDPVSNIILNTIALLPPKPKQAASSSSPPASRTVSWRPVALRSYQSLLGFLMAYFGCLTKVQATRYLYRADANLLLAVMLIQHDLYVAEGQGEAFDPESGRTQAALEWAATMERHPSPTMLANLMSIHLKAGDFDLISKCFGSGAPRLTVEHVWAIHRILHKMMAPMCFANIVHSRRKMVISYGHILEASCSEITTPYTTQVDNARTVSTTLAWVGTPISSLQSEVLPQKLQDCLTTADQQKHYLKKNPCACACDYLHTLDMFVNGMIHNLYIKVLKLMPTPSGSLMRSILKAGHCYGCMDPLSNIIVNSIWYNCRGCNLSVSERREMAPYSDLFDPLCLLRTQLHSLKGLTKLAAFVDPRFSVPDCALEFLCSAKCDIANMLSSSTPERSGKNQFQEAAEAAGHPLPLWLGELHQQLLLMPNEKNKLLSFINQARTSHTVLRVDDMTCLIAAMWDKNRPKAQTVDICQDICEEALMEVSSKRSEYHKRRGKLRPKIQRLLKEYTTQQFPGPEYKLGTILGVEERTRGHPPLGYVQYNVNFTATRDLQLEKTLFFAEFRLYSREPKPDFCCPIPYAYAGRCYHGEHSARKIVYPDDAKYIPDDITYPGTRSLEGMLGMDLVYFSPEFDVELAENLNMLSSEEEQQKKRRRV